MACFESPEEVLIRNELAVMSLDGLPLRTLEIVADRLHGETLKTIGERHGIGKERVRQIYEQAIRRARHKLIAIDDDAEAICRDRVFRHRDARQKVQARLIDLDRKMWFYFLRYTMKASDVSEPFGLPKQREAA